MKKIVIGATVIAFMAAGVQAGITVTVTNLGPVGPGLTGFMVAAVGTEGDLVGRIADVNLTGDAHQIWPFTSTGTPVFGDITDNYFGDPLWEAWDTHMLFGPGASDTLEIGFGSPPIVEANDDSDPASIGPLDYPMAGWTATVGMGGLAWQDDGSGLAQISFTSSPRPAAVDFLYVVLAEQGPYAELDVNVIEDGGIAFTEFVDIPIVEPEPATMLFLLGGALLAVIRRR